MRVLIQRVSEASVSVGGEERSRIGAGMLLLVGIETADEEASAETDGKRDGGETCGKTTREAGGDDIEWLVGKIARLRIFDDADGVMNLDILQTGGNILAISQFTLHASTRKGNRPSYIRAARPEVAEPLYEKFVARLSMELGREVKTGVFGADMQVALTNDGPVTILIDSRNKE